MPYCRHSNKSRFSRFCVGILLLLAGFADAAPFAYIANFSSNNVSVIDTATNSVVVTVAVGNAPSGVAVNPAGTRAYVTNQNSNNVSVIDTATNTVVATVAVGTNPFGVAVNPTGTRAYVANQGSNVSVIDTATNTVVTTVAVGTTPVGVAVNPAGTRAYVTNQNSSNVSVIDTATNTVVATVAVGTSPYGVAVNPAGTRVYATNASNGSVSVIDTATNTVVATVAVGSGSISVAVNPAGTRAYVTNQFGNTVSVIDTATNTVVATVAAGTQPRGTAVNAAGTRVFVANGGSSNVSVIDTATNTVVATVTVGSGPHGFGLFIGPNTAVPGAATIGSAIASNAQALVSFTAPASNGGSPITGYTATCNPGAISASGTSSPIRVTGLTNGTTYSCSVQATNAIGASPSSATVKATPSATAFAGPFAYIPNQPSNSVSVIDTATNTVVATVAVGTSPGAAAVNRAATRAYVTNINSNNVSVIDTATNTVVATVAVGNLPFGIAVNPAGTRAYVTSNSNRNVSVIDTATNTVIATTAVGVSPRGVDINPVGTRAYVANRTSNNVSVIDTATNAVIATVAVGTSPYGVTVNPAGTRTFVTNRDSNNVSVIDTATNTVIATVATGNFPYSVAVNSAGTRAYVTNQNSNNVSVIDTATNTVIATVAVGTSPVGVAVNPAGTRAYVPNFNSDNVSVIDTATNTVVATISVGSGPIALGQFIGGQPPTLTVSGTITPTVANITANIQYRPADVGTTGSVYVFALVPASLLPGAASSSQFRGNGTTTAADPSATCVLAQLNSSGQLVAATASTLQAYLTGVLNSQGAAVSVLNSISTAVIQGAVFFVGYGTSSGSMINSGSYGTVASVAGAQSCQPMDYTVPDLFSLTALNGVGVSQNVSSNAVSITGVAFLAGPVSVSNGSYRINGGAFTSSAGLISRGDNVTVQVLSSANPNSQSCATLTIGGVSVPFCVTTAPAAVTNYSLSVANVGAGAGAVISSPVGISCSANCSNNFTDGTTVTLTATPASGSVFAGWSGDCTGTGPCTVTMSAAKSVTATYPVQPAAAVPQVSLSAISLDFAAQILGNSSSTQTLTLTNSGAGALNIASITATGNSAVTSNCGASLGAGSSCTLSVTFTPAVAGASSGSVRLSSDAVGSPHTIALTGTGIAPLSAPGLSSVVARVGSAALTFTAPVDNGGTPIASYTATCTAAGQVTRTASGTGSPLTVTGLSGGVAYSCSVTATNAGGTTSGASNVVQVTPFSMLSVGAILLLLLD